MISQIGAAPAYYGAQYASAHQSETDRAAASAPAGESANEQDEKSAAAGDDDSARLRELKARDREVRAHEQAHLSAAGGFAKGGASFTYERGPDQQLYAVGGEVQVDTAVVAGDPVATLRKAQVIRRAALAPVNPSSQDRTVAAEASQMAAEARAQMVEEKSSTDEADSSGEADPVAADALAESAASCPSCGGAHASAAHDGMTAYAAQQQPPTHEPSLSAIA